MKAYSIQWKRRIGHTRNKDVLIVLISAFYINLSSIQWIKKNSEISLSEIQVIIKCLSTPTDLLLPILSRLSAFASHTEVQKW